MTKSYTFTERVSVLNVFLHNDTDYLQVIDIDRDSVHFLTNVDQGYTEHLRVTASAEFFCFPSDIAPSPLYMGQASFIGRNGLSFAFSEEFLKRHPSIVHSKAFHLSVPNQDLLAFEKKIIQALLEAEQSCFE